MQPRGPDGRWTPVGQRIAQAAELAGQNVVHHAVVGTVRRPAEIKKLTGIDVRGFKHGISNQSLRHALTHHGTVGERRRGQLPVDRSDFDRLPEILRTATYSAGKPRKLGGPPRVQLTATVAGVHYDYVAEVRRGQKRLDMITMWKRG